MSEEIEGLSAEIKFQACAALVYVCTCEVHVHIITLFSQSKRAVVMVMG